MAKSESMHSYYNVQLPPKLFLQNPSYTCNNFFFFVDYLTFCSKLNPKRNVKIVKKISMKFIKIK